MQLSTRITAIFFPLLLVSVLSGYGTSHAQESTGEYIDDTVITTKVKTAIFEEESLKSAEVNVETYKGIVQLSGFVSSQADINKAIAVAHSVNGVTSVTNDMHLK